MQYSGGKNAAGTYQKIINQIPPHDFYCEPFAGSAAIRRLMRPTKTSLLIDRDPGTIANLAGEVPAGTQILQGDGLAWLERDPDYVALPRQPSVVYCDPPYLASVCTSPLRYRFILTEDEHHRLLRRLKQLRCYVLISGYYSDLYAEALSGWRVIHWPQMTRGGYAREEWLWMNYPEPTELHEYRYLGDDYREREDLARMIKRWRVRLHAMPRLKRLAIMAAIAQSQPSGRSGGTSDAARSKATAVGSATDPGRTRRSSR